MSIGGGVRVIRARDRNQALRSVIIPELIRILSLAESSDELGSTTDSDTAPVSDSEDEDDATSVSSSESVASTVAGQAPLEPPSPVRLTTSTPPGPTGASIDEASALAPAPAPLPKEAARLFGNELAELPREDSVTTRLSDLKSTSIDVIRTPPSTQALQFEADVTLPLRGTSREQAQEVSTSIETISSQTRKSRSPSPAEQALFSEADFTRLAPELRDSIRLALTKMTSEELEKIHPHAILGGVILPSDLQVIDPNLLCKIAPGVFAVLLFGEFGILKKLVSIRTGLSLEELDSKFTEEQINQASSTAFLESLSPPTFSGSLASLAIEDIINLRDNAIIEERQKVARIIEKYRRDSSYNRITPQQISKLLPQIRIYLTFKKEVKAPRDPNKARIEQETLLRDAIFGPDIYPTPSFPFAAKPELLVRARKFIRSCFKK